MAAFAAELAALFQSKPKLYQYEPSPRWGHFAGVVGDNLYVFSGRTARYRDTTEREKLKNVVEVFNCFEETWTQTTTKGELPQAAYRGACCTTGEDLFIFGGYGGGELWYGDLYRLRPSQNFTWTKLSSLAKKCGSRIINLNSGSKLLVIFGGYGPLPTADIQPEAQFVRNTQFTDGRGWTNELHFFDLDTGLLSSPQVTGSRPPPCAYFSFTSVSENRAVLFGGKQPARCACVESLDDVYLFSIDTLHWTKFKRAMGEVWPEGRCYHAACCLDHGGEQPQLLITGGLRSDDSVLADAWMLDVSTIKWKKLALPIGELQPRFYHSITSITLAPGLIEVIIFGGCPEWPTTLIAHDDWAKVAESLIITFSKKSREYPSTKDGPSNWEWVLVDVANNSQRGTTERLREKIAKITTAYKAKEMVNRREPDVPSTSNTSSALDHAESVSMRETLQTLEEEKKILEQRLEDAVRQVQTSVDVAKRRAEEVRGQLQEVTLRADSAEERLRETTHLLAEANQRAVTAEEAIQDLGRQHWVIERDEIMFTERELGRGGWGVVKVAKFRGIDVAGKQLFQEISPFYRLSFIREMNMAARICHPNLVQFIGATLNNEPIILTELISTSLRAVLERGPIAHTQIVSISLDVARALNYLHLMQPDPIIHQDISSANVLLNPLPDNQWKAKISDYGSVNLMRQLKTEGPGSPVYAAPEVNRPSQQSPKMDIFSFGILLIETLTDTFPEVASRNRLIGLIEHRGFVSLIRRCLSVEKDHRPSASDIITELGEI